MARRKRFAADQPEIPGMRATLAAMVAEGLLCHPHACPARQGALEVLRRAGLDETQFLTRWAAGDYDE